MKWNELTDLAKAATLLGAVGIVSLGLCGVSAIGNDLLNVALLGALGLIASAAGLLLLGILVLIRWLVGLIFD
jgi:hypothetical protein